MVEPASVFSAYDIKTLLYVVIAIMFVVVILLFLALVFHAIYVELKENRVKRLKQGYVKEIDEKPADDAFRIIRPSKKIEYDVLADVLAEALEGVSSAGQERFQNLARELGVCGFYERRVKSRSWVKRFVAIEKLGLLKLPEMRAVFCSMLGTEKNTDVTAKAIWAISLIAEESEIDIINRVLERPFFMSAKFAEYIYMNVIESLGRQGKEKQLIEYLESIRENTCISETLKKAMIEACGSIRLHSAKDVILSYLLHFNHVPEMRITCLRAIGELGSEGALDVLRAHLNDEDWRVRAVAARSASSCSTAIVKDLRRSLYDDNYNVRMNAALSLSKLGDKGISALRNEAKSADRFVRDLTAYMLREVSIYA